MNLTGPNGLLTLIKSIVHNTYQDILALRDVEQEAADTIKSAIQSYPDLSGKLSPIAIYDNTFRTFVDWATSIVTSLSLEYVRRNSSFKDVAAVMPRILYNALKQNGLYFNQPSVTINHTTNSKVLYVDHSYFQPHGGVSPLADDDWNVITQDSEGFHAERHSPRLFHEITMTRDIESSILNSQWTLTINEYPVVITDSINYRSILIGNPGDVSRFSQLMPCTIESTGENQWKITQTTPRQQYSFSIAGEGSIVKTREADIGIHWPSNFQVPAGQSYSWIIDFATGVYTCGGAAMLRQTSSNVDVLISVNHVNANVIPNSIRLTSLSTSWSGFAFPVCITYGGSYILNVMNNSSVGVVLGSFGIAPALPSIIDINPNADLVSQVVYSRRVQWSLASWLGLIGLPGIYSGTTLVE